MKVLKSLFVNILIIFFFIGKLYGQYYADTIIFWNKDRGLKCADFKGNKPSAVNNLIAGTAAEIDIIGDRKDKLPNFRVYCFFDNKTSWMIDTMCPLILNHEQTHFNIAELYARKIRKGVSDLRKKNEIDIKLYDKLIKTLLEERNMTDDTYDKETLHGIYHTKQEEWNNKIAQKLLELKAFTVDYLKY